MRFFEPFDVFCKWWRCMKTIYIYVYIYIYRSLYLQVYVMYQVKTVQRVGAMMFLWGSFAYLAFQIHVPNFGGISAGICLPCIFLLHHLGLVVANVGSSRRSLASRCLSSEKLGDQSSWTLFANAYSGAGEFHWFDPGRCRVREGQLSRIQCICIYVKRQRSFNGWESAEGTWPDRVDF